MVVVASLYGKIPEFFVITGYNGVLKSLKESTQSHKRNKRSSKPPIFGFQAVFLGVYPAVFTPIN